MSHRAPRDRVAILEALAAAHPDATDFSMRPDDRQPQFVSSVLQLQDLTVRKTSTSGYRCEVGPTDAIRVALPMRGGVSLSSASTKSVGRAGLAGLVCYDQHIVRDVLADYRGYHIQTSRDRLIQAAQQIVGRAPLADRIDPLVDIQSQAGSALCRNVATLFAEVEQLARLGLGSLALASANDIILTLTAIALLPDARRHLAEPAMEIDREFAERARQYLEGHAADPVRLYDLAFQLGISLRALQLGFKKHFACTPSDYLSHVVS